MKQARRTLKDFEMTTSEEVYVKEFYDLELSVNATFVFSEFFKEVKNSILKQYLTKVCLAKAKEFSFFRRLVQIIVKTNQELPKLEFLFDVFSSFGDKLEKQQIKDFIRIFELSPDHFNNKKEIDRDTFLDLTQECDLNFNLYEQAKFSIIGMIGLSP